MTANPTDAAYRKTRYADIRNPAIMRRQYSLIGTGLERPSSIIWYIECPFCEHEIKAYLWSLSGGGKRCEWCGAIMGARGDAFKLPSNKEDA